MSTTRTQTRASTRTTNRTSPRRSRVAGNAAASLTPAVAQAPDGSRIPERTVCLVAELRRVGNRKKVSSAQVEVDADRDAISVSKTLLDAPQLLAIVNFDTTIRRFITAHCLPSFFRGGVFLLPLVSLENVEAKLRDLQRERERLVEEFLADYPALVEQARARLRGLFESSDYPPVESVRQEFAFVWSYMAFEVPATLEAIDREIFNREREKAALHWDEAAANIQTLLRANMLELVNNMTERLAPTGDGQRKIFKNSLVSNLTEFLRNFDARNIADDTELARVVAQARELLSGVDPQLLRDSDNVRANVQNGFAQVRQELGSMLANRPVRRIVMAERSSPIASNARTTADMATEERIAARTEQSTQITESMAA